MPSSMFCFVIFYLFSFILVINSDDWFLVWLGMELNMISFVFLIYIRESLINIEGCMKYFFVQSLGSVFLMSIFFLNNKSFIYLGSLIMSYKMGAGPFYFWFPSVCGGISWVSCYLIMTFQKVIPLILISVFLSWVLWVIILSSLFIGVMGSFGQIEMKKLLAYSSINHMGWLMICEIVDSKIWLFYLFCYCLILIPVVVFLKEVEVNNYKSMSKVNEKWLFFLMMMNMGGVPPMLGFFMKWLSFYYISFWGVMLVFMMIIMSMVMLYVYIRMCYMMMMGEMIIVGWNNFEIKISGSFFEGIMMMGVIFGGFIVMIFYF